MPFEWNNLFVFEVIDTISNKQTPKPIKYVKSDEHISKLCLYQP